MTESTSQKLKEIEAEIEATKKELQNARGTQTEVYARIVGYYRAVKNWNKGKRDEYNNRTLFSLDDDINDLRPANTNSKVEKISEKEEIVSSNKINSSQLTYEFFMRKTCPNCPSVKEFILSTAIDGIIIDVDTEKGLSEAALKGVFSAPTVIFYDKNGFETSRCHSVEELQNVLSLQAVVA